MASHSNAIFKLQNFDMLVWVALMMTSQQNFHLTNHISCCVNSFYGQAKPNQIAMYFNMHMYMSLGMKSTVKGESAFRFECNSIILVLHDKWAWIGSCIFFFGWRMSVSFMKLNWYRFYNARIIWQEFTLFEHCSNQKCNIFAIWMPVLSKHFSLINKLFIR